MVPLVDIIWEKHIFITIPLINCLYLSLNSKYIKIILKFQGLMVVGFDVYHDSQRRGMSIGALVASLDKTLSRYFSTVSYHRNGEELSTDLSANICSKYI